MKTADNKHLERKPILLGTVLLNAIILERGFTTNPAIYWWLLVSLPIVAATLFFAQLKRPSPRKKNTATNAIQSFQTKNYA